MRLLKVNKDGSFGLESFSEKGAPPFAILSHTWSANADDEVKLQDLKDGTYATKTGSQKLLFCSKQAKHDDLQYFWVDTCCIDQTNNVELTESINSMFRWYQKAAKCYVYLSDVSRYTQDGKSHVGWESAFRNCRWFTRAWTLQELLAPNIVEFYSRDGIQLGDKRSFVQQISEITRIPPNALQGDADRLSSFSIEERFTWAMDRQTTKEEDKAYCLLGIFGIFLPLIYGEGHLSAMRRLRDEIGQYRNVDPISISTISHKQHARLCLIMLTIFF
jgi:hypothetical protein